MARRALAPHLKTTTAEDLAAKAVRITEHYWNRAKMAGWQRWATNMANWDAYHHRMDWSHKKPWQTQQTLPDFGVSIEQTVGAFERTLSDSDDWLSVDPVGIGDPPLDPDTIQHLLLYYLERLWVPGDAAETSYGIAALIADTLKRGLLESVITWKIYARLSDKVRYRLEPGEPVQGPRGHREDLPAHDLTPHGPPGQGVERIVTKDFRLCIDLIPYEDYYRDPSLQNVYEIHEVTRNLTELEANPDYDPSVVKIIRGSANATLADAYKRRSQATPYIQHDPWEVRVREAWGDLIDPTTGDVLATNSFWTVCNGQLLRPPTPNPFWHGKRPFVHTPLIPTPNSTVHRALADAAVSIWRFMNEDVSLMMDGAIRSVWGVNQSRPDIMQYPEQFSEGVPQADTIELKANTPEGMKAIEALELGGEVPQYALEMFNLAQREYQQAMLTNDLQLGQLPPRQVKATEIVESMQARGSLLESLSARVETRHLDPGLELAWQVILQYEDDLVEPELVAILGPERTLALMRMEPAQRFVLLAQAGTFRVRGLRGVASRNRLVTKIGNLLQLMSQDPDIAAEIKARYSMGRIVEQYVRGSGIDPATIEKTPQEIQQDQQQQDQQAAQGLVAQAQQDVGARHQGVAPPASGVAPPPGAGPNGGSPPALANMAADQATVEGAQAPRQPGSASALGAMGL